MPQPKLTPRQQAKADGRLVWRVYGSVPPDRRLFASYKAMPANLRTYWLAVARRRMAAGGPLEFKD